MSQAKLCREASALYFPKRHGTMVYWTNIPASKDRRMDEVLKGTKGKARQGVPAGVISSVESCTDLSKSWGDRNFCLPLKS